MKSGYVLAAILSGVLISTAAAQTKSHDVDLPTSKLLSVPTPGAPQRTNSLPVTAALSPDGKYLALLNNGFGSVESDYHQSIAILDRATNQLRDYPDSRLARDAKQSYFIGLAWNDLATELYASFGSLTDPEGKQPGTTGNGIAVYRFANGELAPDRFLKLPLVPISNGRKNTYGAEVRSGRAKHFLSRRIGVREAARVAMRYWLPKTLQTMPCSSMRVMDGCSSGFRWGRGSLCPVRFLTRLS